MFLKEHPGKNSWSRYCRQVVCVINLLYEGFYSRVCKWLTLELLVLRLLKFLKLIKYTIFVVIRIQKYTYNWCAILMLDDHSKLWILQQLEILKSDFILQCFFQSRWLDVNNFIYLGIRVSVLVWQSFLYNFELIIMASFTKN